MATQSNALISAQALREGLEPPRRVVVDCRFDLLKPAAGRAAYAAGHIPGARYADLDHDLAAPARGPGGRHPLPAPTDFALRLARWGIGPDSAVVVYDDAGGAIAGRLWWLLRWAGHRRVAVLDGGWAAWTKAGFPVSTAPEPAAAARQPAALRVGQMPVTDAAQLAADLKAGRRLLIDLRTPARFAGREEPIDAVAGHVPGALNLPLGGNLDSQGRFLAPDALRERYQAVLAGRPADEAVLMCGSGVSACHGLVAMAHAGLPGAALYTGSWSDWIADGTRPVARL